MRYPKTYLARRWWVVVEDVEVGIDHFSFFNVERVNAATSSGAS
jgi:hypothetical protein